MVGSVLDVILDCKEVVEALATFKPFKVSLLLPCIYANEPDHGIDASGLV